LFLQFSNFDTASFYLVFLQFANIFTVDSLLSLSYFLPCFYTLLIQNGIGCCLFGFFICFYRRFESAVTTVFVTFSAIFRHQWLLKKKRKENHKARRQLENFQET
jgi:hypothetical protein